MDMATISAIAALDPRLRDRGHIHHPLTYVSLTTTVNTVLLTAPDGHTLWLFCLIVHNRATSNVTLDIGTGSTLTQRIPRLGRFIPNFWEPVWLPPTHFESTIYVTASAATIDVMPYAIAVG